MKKMLRARVLAALRSSKEAWRARSVQCDATAQVTDHILSPIVGDLAEGLETPVQAIYLVTLLGFLVVGAYLVVRQVLIRRELEEAAKSLGDRIRTGNASSEVRPSIAVSRAPKIY